MKKIISILLAATLILSLSACEISESNPSSNQENTEVEEQVIYEDDILKAVYKGVSETSGVVIMTVELKNKSDVEITVLPMDSSVDETMIQFTSGTLATIQAGKTLNQGWIIGSMPTQNIEFSMSICDENMSELVQTDSLTIEVE